jgi:hypothetical protein
MNEWMARRVCFGLPTAVGASPREAGCFQRLPVCAHGFALAPLVKAPLGEACPPLALSQPLEGSLRGLTTSREAILRPWPKSSE